MKPTVKAPKGVKVRVKKGYYNADLSFKNKITFYKYMLSYSEEGKPLTPLELRKSYGTIKDIKSSPIKLKECGYIQNLVAFGRSPISKLLATTGKNFSNIKLNLLFNLIPLRKGITTQRVAKETKHKDLSKCFVRFFDLAKTNFTKEKIVELLENLDFEFEVKGYKKRKVVEKKLTFKILDDRYQSKKPATRLFQIKNSVNIAIGRQKFRQKNCLNRNNYLAVENRYQVNRLFFC